MIDRIVVDDGCWEWDGAHNRDGYGTAYTELTGAKPQGAHRVIYQILIGPIPDGLELDHLCRNRGCVNPAHLEPVTKAENILRGFGFGARNARKTHCPQGHAYDDENTRVTNGRRICRACHRDRERERKRASRHTGEAAQARKGAGS